MTLMDLKTWFSFYKKSFLILCFFLVLIIIFIIISIGTGPVNIPVFVVFSILMDLEISDQYLQQIGQFSAIVTGIRLPRVLLTILVGATLSLAGASLQGLFRNPLADPSLIGVSSGSAFAAAVIIILGNYFIPYLPNILISLLLPIAAFIGGLIATLIVYVISTKYGKTSVTTMLLAGIAINALAGAGIGFLVYIANDLQIRDLTFWTLGSLGSSTWETFYTAAPFLVITIIGLPFLARPLNVMLLGEHEARHLGIHTQFVKKIVIILAAFGVGASVAVSGVIGFVGLVVPHLLRLIIGPDHRFLLPGSILLGSLLLLASDLFARMIVIPAELPIGIVTASVGAPFFIWLLVKNRSLNSY